MFYRALVKQGAAIEGRVSAPSYPGFVARMIDNGYAFNGPNWDFPESPVQGLYARSAVYQAVRSLDDFQPWLDRIARAPLATLVRQQKISQRLAETRSTTPDELNRLLGEHIHRQAA